MSYCRKFEEWMINWFREHIRFILGTVLGGVLVYFPMLSQDLVNDADGIWHTSHFIAGNWEISLGRGLLRYFDKMRFGVVSVPLNSILTLLLAAAAAAVILDLFEIKNRTAAALIAGILITSPVICAVLSYCYTSVNYGIAFLFSVLAAACILSKRRSGRCLCILGSLCIAVSMACYQAYLGVTCLLLLSAVSRMLLGHSQTGEIRKLLVRIVCSLACGGVFYLLLVKAVLFRAGIELAEYRGASEAGLKSMVLNLPDSVGECYRQYCEYFFRAKMYADLPLAEVLICGIFILYVSAAIVQFIRLFRKSKGRALGFLLCTAMMPAACNAVLLAAVGNAASILMSMGMAMSAALIYIFLPQEGKSGRGFQRCYCILAALLCWFQLASVANDQLAMKEGRDASVTLAENILGKLIAGGYLEKETSVVLVGRPADSPLFIQSAAYQGANAYARFGNWAIDAGNYRRSWMGVLTNYCGVDLNLCGEAQYDEIRRTEAVAEMPVFPYEGSIRRIENFVVVKISEVY